MCLALLAVAVPCAPAAAAFITTEAVDASLTVIFLSGEIALGDEQQFADVAVATKGNVVVVFDSPGGNLVAGMAIGNAIHIKGFFTAVPVNFHCASACALAWLAGRVRMMGDGATIGFHAAYRMGDDVPDATANALVGAYLNQLGLNASAIVFVTEALPADIQWLTFDTAESIGISVTRLDPAVESETAGPTSADGDRWIQIFSRSAREAAVQIASSYSVSAEKASVFLYDNGWYGVVLGPFPREVAAARRARLMALRQIPSDSFVVRGEKFVRLVWGNGTDSFVSAPDPAVNATSAVLSYFEASSLPAADALSMMRELYPDNFLYFGRWVSRDEALADKAKFVRRWQERRYDVDNASLRTHCSGAGSCTVEGIVDWWAYNPEENKTSTGTAEFRLTFSSVEPVVIMSDESTVTRRRVISGRVAGAFARY